MWGASATTSSGWLFVLALLVLLSRGFGQEALLVVFDQINPKAGDELVVGLAERCQRVVSLGVKAALADLRVDISRMDRDPSDRRAD